MVFGFGYFIVLVDDGVLDGAFVHGEGNQGGLLI